MDLKEYLGKNIKVKIDRPLGSKHPKWNFVYEVNYGYIPGTKAPDREEIDAYVLGVDRSLKEFEGRVIAIIQRLDDDDDKLVVAADGAEFSDGEIGSQVAFQEKYFKSKIIR
ncbi:inorganic diphosphatase [Patescibacteria group bacterium]|nr:inorganic diphosphatase [Patescibacteria group bacterium]MBU4511655.1 inorganic diphosphatase [Patescibacteria group bacterium]MCG2693293.1 inorganic diphosphatase [Candidatus Parcubacteria bacterium]